MGNIFKKNKSKKVLEPSDEYFCYRSCLDDEWIRKQKLEKIIHEHRFGYLRKRKCFEIFATQIIN